MKRCPKCNRTYTTANQKFCIHDGEILAEASAPDALVQPFDPYKTAVGQTTEPPAEASSSLPSAPPASSAPPSPASTPQAQPLKAAPPAKPGRARLIVGILAVVFLLSLGVVAAAYIFLIRPMLAKRTGVANSTERTRPGTPRPTAPATPPATPEPGPSEQPVVVAPPNSTEFVNAPDNLDGKLAEHYIDFSFYYPKSWIKDPEAGVPGAVNFAKVERRRPPDLTQESFAVGWYTSTGSEVLDRKAYPEMVQKLSSRYQKEFPEYRKVSEGDAKAGIYHVYEFRFEAMARGTANGDLEIWGRTVFLPAREGERTGAILLMLATSLARELKSHDDVGVKGELPIILESFRLGKK